MATPFNWPLTESYKVLNGTYDVDSVGNYRWIVILGGFLAFAMAWGIGANDVANSFATSVGAGSLTLRWACIIAGVMEFLGAFLMGSNVTDTVRKKIIDPSVFDPTSEGGAQNGPEILMTGFLVALITATTWLILATYLSLPVSTTHSIIGSLIGVGLAYRGGSAVVWISSGSGFKKLKGVVGVVLSWVISPVLSAIFAVSIFLVVRTLVLRSKNPVRNGFLFLPLFYMMTISVTIFFIIYKGSPKFKLDKKFSVGQAVGIALGSGAGAALLAWWFVIPQAKARIDRWEQKELEKLRNPSDHSPPSTNCTGPVVFCVFPLPTSSDRMERTPSELVFPATQSGAPGAASAEFSLYDEEGVFTKDATCYTKCAAGNAADYSSKKQSVDLWILALGGIGIVAGLAMWGYRIIVAIGVKLTKLTPSRGFSIEIGAAITVIIASRIGLPVSTTHCQVGATVGVGLVEFKKGTVNWKQFLGICAGWVFTVVFTGFLAAGIFSLLIYTPRKHTTSKAFPPTYCPGDGFFVFDSEASGFRGVSCNDA